MTQSFQVDLLHGLGEGGGRHLLAVLREPTGHDEAMLSELAHATPADCTSAILAALVLGIGECRPVTVDQILQLTVGDRERLLLAISARLLGGDVDLVTPCPSCRELAEIPVRLGDVIGARPAAVSGRVELQASDGLWIARCRPPTGADLDNALRRGTDGPRLLTIGCVEELIDPTGTTVAASALPAECEAALADALAEFDPAAEFRVVIECPSCAGKVEALIDGLTLLRSALGGMARLYDDVYRMARAYHWSEAEILSLPLRRRRHYLSIAENSGMAS